MAYILVVTGMLAANEVDTLLMRQRKKNTIKNVCTR